MILNLNQNELVSLPEEIGALTSLRRLCLGGNLLRAVPVRCPVVVTPSSPNKSKLTVSLLIYVPVDVYQQCVVRRLRIMHYANTLCGRATIHATLLSGTARYDYDDLVFGLSIVVCNHAHCNDLELP